MTTLISNFETARAAFYIALAVFLAFKGRHYAMRDDRQVKVLYVLPPTPDQEAHFNAGMVRS